MIARTKRAFQASPPLIGLSQARGKRSNNRDQEAGSRDQGAGSKGGTNLDQSHPWVRDEAY